MAPLRTRAPWNSHAWCCAKTLEHCTDSKRCAIGRAVSYAKVACGLLRAANGYEMNAEWTPMRWPVSWKSPSALGLLKGTPINWLLVDKDASLAPIIEQAKQAGLHVAEIASPPDGVAILPGEWPGIAMSHGGGTSAGPTGVPWVDSNSWKIRLQTARRPASTLSGEAPPKPPPTPIASYRTP